MTTRRRKLKSTTLPREMWVQKADGTVGCLVSVFALDAREEATEYRVETARGIEFWKRGEFTPVRTADAGRGSKPTTRETMTTPRSGDNDKTLETIAREELGLETLETRNSDRLDFHDVAVWSVRKALERAYAAGCESVTQRDGELTPPKPADAGRPGA